LDGAVDGGACDAEQLGDFGSGVRTLEVQLHQVVLLCSREFGLLTAQTALGLRHGHSLARAHPDQIRLELRDHPEHVEQQPADRVARVVDAAAEAERDTFSCELVRDVARVGQGPGEPVELRDDECVAGTYCR